MTAPSFRSFRAVDGSPADPAPAASQKSLEINRHARPFDADRFRSVYPDRWQAFLKAHFRSIEEVAVFFGVTDEAARKWWHGVGGPRGAQVSIAFTVFPAGAARFLRAA